ncbi:LutC/YkgG family protein [Solemya velum gill symbiont]|nr:lactate utilization protein [Solemya velum gill symbiont]KHF25397.1 hypothetical protein JV46_11080 [Solemya velum gill symbiont]
MSESRNRILEALKAHSSEADLPSPPVYKPQLTWSKDEKLDCFQTMLESVHGEVHRIQEDQLGEKLAQLLKQKEVKRLLCSPKFPQAIYDGLNAIECLRYDRHISEWKEELFNSVDASITTTLCGVAQTGTLVLWPDREEPRLASLVPPIHIAVVEADTIVETFAEAISEGNWASQMPTNALLISGPSKTADIEQILAYGIHGPKQLIVLIVNNQE